MVGFVVEHKVTELRYAVSDHNFNPQVHEFVRDLLPGETVYGFQPKPKPKPKRGVRSDSEPKTEDEVPPPMESPETPTERTNK